MRYSYTVPAGILRPAFATAAIATAIRQAGIRHAEADARWPMIVRALKTLRERGRRSIRIVDTTCGAGDVLIEAVRRARALGFVAIEARGIDRDPALVARARATARSCADPATGVTFDVGEPIDALRAEAEFPADLVLYAAPEGPAAPIDKAAGAAGRIALRVPGRPARRLAA